MDGNTGGSDAADESAGGKAARGQFRLTEADLMDSYLHLGGRAQLACLAMVVLYLVLEIGSFLAAAGAMPGWFDPGTPGSGWRDLIATGIVSGPLLLLGNLLLLALIVAGFALPRLTGKRHLRSVFQIPGAGEMEREIRVTAADFSLITDQGAQRYDWDDFHWYARRREATGADVLLLRGHTNWLILPASIADQGIDLEAFIGHFNRNDAPDVDPVSARPKRKPRPALWPLYWPLLLLWRGLSHLLRRAPRRVGADKTEQAVAAAAPSIATAAESAAATEAAPARRESTARYRLTADHLDAITAAVMPRFTFTYFLMLLIIAGNVTGGLTLLWGAPSHEAWFGISLFLFHLMLIGLLIHCVKAAFIQPRREIRGWLERAALAGPDMTIEMTDADFTIRHRDGWQLFHWGDIQWWRRTARNILFRAGSPWQNHAVPISVAESGFDLAGLIDRLGRALPENGTRGR